jgi:hypothetical protein
VPIAARRQTDRHRKNPRSGTVRKTRGDVVSNKQRKASEVPLHAQTRIVPLDSAEGGATRLRSRHSLVDQRIDLLLSSLNKDAATSPSVGIAYSRQRMSMSGRGGKAVASKDVLSRLGGLQEIIAAAEYIGLDMSKAREKLAAAGTHYGKRHLENARKEIRAATRETNKMISQAMPSALKSSEEDVKTLEDSGVDVKSEKALLTTTSRAIKNKKIDYAVLALAECRRKLHQTELRPATKAILAARDALVSARRAGHDVGAARVLLKEAITHLKEGQVEEAIEAAKRCQAAAEEPGNLKKKALELLRLCTRSISLAKGFGADVAEARELVTQGHKMMNGGNFALAAEFAKKGITSATVQTSAQVARLIGLAEMNVELARNADIPIEDAEDKLEMAREHLTRNEFVNSIEMAYASMFGSNTAIAAEMQKRVKRFDQFAKDLNSEIESFKQVQEAIDHSKDRSLETIRKYATLSEEIVSQAYENASAYARVSQDIMGQASESTISLANDRTPAESENASIRTFSSVLGQVMSITNGDRRLRLIDAYLSGKLSSSELEKLLAMVESDPAKLEIVQQ